MSEVRPTAAQLRYLRRGLAQPGHKLPLFDKAGQQISIETVRSCIRRGWAEPWFNNPIKRDWLVCRLTDKGVAAAQRQPVRRKPMQRRTAAAQPAQERPAQERPAQEQPAWRRAPVHLEMV